MLVTENDRLRAASTLPTRIKSSCFQFSFPYSRTSLAHLLIKVCMTTAYRQSWEHDVLPLAFEAEHQSLSPDALSINDTSLLARAYAYCDSITSTNSKTFSMANMFL